MFEEFKCEHSEDRKSTRIDLPNGDVVVINSHSLCVYTNPDENPKLIYIFG